MKKRIRKSEKVIFNYNSDKMKENAEPMIDGKPFSEVFSDFEHNEEVKIVKNNDASAKEFEINFDPNADVKLKKKKGVWKILASCVAWVMILVVGGLGGYVIGDMIVAKLNVYDPNKYSGLAESVETIEQWQNQHISSLSATQVFVVAEQNLKECDYYSVTTKGYNGEDKGLININLFGGMTQTLWGYRYVNGEDAYFTYYSESNLVQVYKKVEYNPVQGKQYIFNGGGSPSNMTWYKSHSDGKEFYTNEEYAELVGCEASNPIDYVVSRKTVLSETTAEVDGGLYKYTITLSAKKAVSNYVKKMKYISGLADFPVFDSITLDFVVDENMNFQTIGVQESYAVNYGVTAPCTGTLRYDFDYDDIQRL